MEIDMIDYSGNITRTNIIYQRFLRVIKTAVLLHIISIIGLLSFIGFGWLALKISLETQFSHLHSIYGMQSLYGFFSIYGLILLFFSQMDAKSRFQNYKKVKDLLHENGFQPRVVNLFISSKCQRDALKVAAIDLKMNQLLELHYKSLGYRWFHLIPDFFFTRPMLIFTQRYWQKTLFEKPYKLKYFLW